VIWQSQRSHTFIALLCYVQRHVPHYLLQFANFDTWVWELQGALSLRLNFELLTLIINYPTHLCFEFLFWHSLTWRCWCWDCQWQSSKVGYLPSRHWVAGWVALGQHGWHKIKNWHIGGAVTGKQRTRHLSSPNKQHCWTIVKERNHETSICT
jgi:hypothetical protein